LPVDNDDGDSSHLISSLPQAPHQLLRTAAAVDCCYFLPASLLHRTKVHAWSSIALAYARPLVEEQLPQRHSNALVVELQLLEDQALHLSLALTDLPQLLLVEAPECWRQPQRNQSVWAVPQILGFFEIHCCLS
jgi:hypothetical protein